MHWDRQEAPSVRRALQARPRRMPARPVLTVWLACIQALKLRCAASVVRVPSSLTALAWQWSCLLASSVWRAQRANTRSTPPQTVRIVHPGSTPVRQARRSARCAALGSTSRVKAKRAASAAPPASMSLTKARAARPIVQRALGASTRTRRRKASAKAAPQGASATQATMRQRRAARVALGSIAAPSRRYARPAVVAR
jgi:hypothetical protein